MTCDTAPATRAAAACRFRLCLRRLDVSPAAFAEHGRPVATWLARTLNTRHACSACVVCVRRPRARARMRTHAWERRGPAHRQHAVEEAVDGVQDAPKNVGNGAGAHHRPPVHHPAVFDEHHRACARVVREGFRLPCPFPSSPRGSVPLPKTLFFLPCLFLCFFPGH